MGRVRLDMVGVMHDALGFSVRRFDDVLRVAWFPLVLVALSPLAWQQLVMNGAPRSFVVALSIVTPLLLTAAYMVPLTRMAAHGEQASRSSIHFSFGVPQIRFALVGLLSVFAALLVALGPTSLGVSLTEAWIQDVAVQEVFVFDEGSLHGGQVNVLFADVTPMRNLQLFLNWVLTPLVLIYAGIRLFLWPFAIAAGAPSPFALSLRASAGANGLRLFLIFLALAFVQVLVSLGSGIAVGAGQWAGSLVTAFVETIGAYGVDGFRWAGRAGGFVGVSVSYIVGVLASALTAGLVAGAAGSLIRSSSDGR
ncbi:MAG: hypothetical protein AAFR65_03755 [Pseudomonadota bacterium]